MRDNEQFDFLVSYTGVDVAWAESVAYVWRRRGYHPCCRPGISGRGGTSPSGCTTPSAAGIGFSPSSVAYLRSAFASAEWAAAFRRRPTGRECLLLPVRVGECEPEGLLRGVVYIDLLGGDETEGKRSLLAGLGRGRTKPLVPPSFSAARFPSRLFPGRVPAVGNVPARNRNFAGRDTEQEELRQALQTGGASVAVVAVSGLGGVGKTQLALEHAWRRARDYDVVWWVPAEVPAAIPAP